MNPGQTIQRLREVARRQHKAISTEQAYVGWLVRYIAAIRAMPAAADGKQLSSEQKLERFLTGLALSNVSASTQNQAFNAIVWFYKDVLERPLANVDALRASRPSRVRHAPTVEDTFRLLNQVGNVAGYPTNLIARMLYGCGLRVCEPLNLRLKDIREDRLFIMGAKGRKDRVVSLPDSLVLEVRGQMDFSKATWEKDCLAKVPVEMPDVLARKYPEYRFAMGWAWLFPSHQPCKHPRTGEWVRWRCHEANVQRAIKQARRDLGIMVLPHELRHAYATHCLDRGTNLKALQEAMGHKQIETTIGYCHADALSVKSPLEQPPSPLNGTMLAVVAPGRARHSVRAAPPLYEPASEPIYEPLRVGIKSSAVQSFVHKAINSELLKSSDPNAEPKRDRVRDLVREALEIVGEATARQYGGYYWNRARENIGKFERVMNAVRSDVKEGAVRNPGGHFADLWRRFAD